MLNALQCSAFLVLSRRYTDIQTGWSKYISILLYLFSLMSQRILNELPCRQKKKIYVTFYFFLCVFYIHSIFGRFSFKRNCSLLFSKNLSRCPLYLDMDDGSLNIQKTLLHYFLSFILAISIPFVNDEILYRQTE